VRYQAWLYEGHLAPPFDFVHLDIPADSDETGLVGLRLNTGRNYGYACQLSADGEGSGFHVAGACDAPDPALDDGSPERMDIVIDLRFAQCVTHALDEPAPGCDLIVGTEVCPAETGSDESFDDDEDWWDD
jgi:hypothetical protein